jgi:hypothetical protein
MLKNLQDILQMFTFVHKMFHGIFAAQCRSLNTLIMEFDNRFTMAFRKKNVFCTQMNKKRHDYVTRR